jgi:hypothetical protein
MVSTMAGKHGSTVCGTEAARKKLVGELERNSDFWSTQSLKGPKFRHDGVIEL